MPEPPRLSPAMQAALRERDTVVVSSRDSSGEGKARMWFALTPDGTLYLLTPSFSLKARRWESDPWVRVRAGRETVEGTVEQVTLEEVAGDEPLLLARFGLAGASTVEALAWMLDSGSHRLFRVRPAPGS
ncbi:MAG: pyridoxamine 5'-phosphate oxidase family protein [Candidatus Dormibacteria bacterium]